MRQAGVKTRSAVQLRLTNPKNREENQSGTRDWENTSKELDH